jgi:hypothetical protein
MSSSSMVGRKWGFAWLGAAFALLILASAAPARAQVAAEGSIRGHVDDGTGAVIPGVTVVATSPSVAGAFRSVSDEAGNYRLTELPPAEDYTVTAELEGFSKYQRAGVIVRAGLNVRLDVSLTVGNLSEAVSVTGSASNIIDTFSSEQSVAISGELIRSLPLTGRREWSDTLQLTPGVLSASTDNYGGQVYFVRGSENENHATLVDGMDVGSFKQNWPSNYISMSTESLGDVQVKTGANDASSPAAMGMVISIATPTGGNQLHGATSLLISPRGWNDQNVPGGFSAVSEAYQPDFSVSGPLVRNKAWFFASGRSIYRNDGISRTERQLNDLRKVVPDFVPFDNEARGFIYVANSTVQLNDKQKLFGVIQYDSRLQGGNVETQAGPYANQQYGGGAYSVRLNSAWSQRLNTRLQVSYNNKGQNDDLDRIGGLSNTLPALNVYQSAQSASGGTLSGNTLLAQLNGAASRSLTPAHKTTVSLDANYFANKWGSHDLQAGTYLQPNLRTWSDTYYANNGFTTEDAALIDQNNPSLGYRPFHRRYVLGDASGTLQGVRTSDTGADDYAFYIQDRWAPTGRLSISPGLRVEWIAAQDEVFDVQTQASWNYAPRIGVAYVLTSNQKHVVRASWGRVTDIPNAGYFDNVGSSTVATRDEYDLDGDGIFETIRSTPATTALAANRTIDPDKHQGYAQEWIVGYRTQLPGGVAFDASYVDRTYKDRPGSVEINQIYEFDPSVGHDVWRGLVDPTQNNITSSTNNTWNWFVYHGLEFTLTKQAKGLNLLGTYTRVWDYLDGTWQPNDPAAIIQPDSFPNEGGIGTVRGSGTNSYTTDTRNRSWQQHQLRLGASWQAPWHLNLSTLLTLQSGIPSGPIVTTIAASDPSYGPATLAINGRSVANPLSTTTRFAYETRADGQLWTPWLKAWNARVGRSFKLGNSATAELDVDVLNIANAGAGQQFLGGNNITSANFGLYQNIQTPRAGQLSFRIQF